MMLPLEKVTFREEGRVSGLKGFWAAGGTLFHDWYGRYMSVPIH